MLLNLAIFQLGWFVCVLGGDYPAMAYTAVALLVHGVFIVEKDSEWWLIAAIGVVGSLWDRLMALTGYLDFGLESWLGIPIWLVCLWLLFATTFLHCLKWLSEKIWMAALAAAVFGPASYWLGANLSDASLGQPVWMSLSVMAVGWAVLFPIGLYQAGKLNYEN